MMKIYRFDYILFFLLFPSLLMNCSWQKANLPERLPSTAWVPFGLFSPDEQDVLMMKSDRVEVMNLKTHHSTLTLLPPEKSKMEFISGSIDGTKVVGVVTGYLKNVQDQLIVWDTTTGAVIAKLGGPNDTSNRMQTATFSPDGQYIVTASMKTVDIWDVKRAQHICSVKHNYAQIASYSPLGDRIVSVGMNEVLVWEVDQLFSKGDALKPKDAPNIENNTIPSLDGISLAQHLIPVLSKELFHDNFAVFSPTGDQLLISGGKNIGLYHLNSKVWVWKTSLPEPIFAATFSPDGKWIIASTYPDEFAGERKGSTVHRLQAETGKMKATLAASPYQFHTSIPIVSASKKWIASLPYRFQHNEVQLMDAKSGKMKQIFLEGTDSGYVKAHLSIDGQDLILDTEHEGKEWRSALSGELKAQSKRGSDGLFATFPDKSWPTAFSLAPNYGCNANSFFEKLYGLNQPFGFSGRMIVLEYSFSQDCSLVGLTRLQNRVVEGKSREWFALLEVWDMNRFVRLNTIVMSEQDIKNVRRLRFSSDGRKLYIVSSKESSSDPLEKSTMTVWDIETGRSIPSETLVLPFPIFEFHVGSERMLFKGSDKVFVYNQWTKNSFILREPLEPHSLQQAFLSKDEKKIITLHQKGVRVVDAQTGIVLLNIPSSAHTQVGLPALEKIDALLYKKEMGSSPKSMDIKQYPTQ